MPEPTAQPIRNRYDFVLFFEVGDANPNGDPDAGNLPRIDTETGQGLVTDVCLKRKVRNYVALARPDEAGYRIFVRDRSVLNQTIQEAYEQSDDVKQAVASWDAWKQDKKKPKPAIAYDDVARRWMCDNFYDIRAFGAVMMTGDEQEIPGVKSKLKMTAGQVRGPVQMGFARSQHPIISSEFAITRCAVTNERDLEKERTIGRKFTVPYALYRVHGYVNPHLASGTHGTGFSDVDLELFKHAIGSMFEFDASAARPPGSMRPVACIAFKHESPLGNARADQLFKRITCTPREGVEPLPGQRDSDGNPIKSGPHDRPPRSTKDYQFMSPPEGPLDGLPKVVVEYWVAWE